MEKAKTGIKGLDNILKGGLPRNAATVMEGPPGAGKSVFAQQFIIEGLKNGEGCMYICVDDPPELVRRRIRDFGWEPQKYEEDGLLVFVDCFSWRIGGSGEKNAVLNEMNYDRLTDVIRTAYDSLKEVKEQRSIVDSMTTLLPQLELQEALRFLSWMKARFINLSKNASLWFTHKASLDPQLYSILLDNAGGIIELRFKEEPETLLRELRVTAMPFEVPTPRWIPYNIDKKGIRIPH